MAWTTPATLVTGDVIQASWANTHVRDNSRYLKGLDGSVVIQDALGIGGSPGQRLHIVDTSSDDVNFAIENDAQRWNVGVKDFGGGTGNAFRIRDTGGDERLVIAPASGNVGVGTTAPSEKLEVNGTAKATTFAGSGANLTAVPASQLNGTVPDGAISGKNISLLNNNSGYLTAASAVAATQLTGLVIATSQSVLNDGSYTICPETAGGVFVLRDDQGNFAVLYLYAGPLQSEIADPFNVFTFVSGTAGSWNLYTSGGNIIIQNRRGSTRTIRIVRLAGG